MKIYLASLNGDPDSDHLDLKAFSRQESALKWATKDKLYESISYDGLEKDDPDDQYGLINWADYRFNGEPPDDLLIIYEEQSMLTAVWEYEKRYRQPENIPYLVQVMTGHKPELYWHAKGAVWSIEVEA